MQSLKQEYATLYAENKKRYPEYKQAKAKMIELLRKIVTAGRRRDDDFSLPADNSRLVHSWRDWYNKELDW